MRQEILAFCHDLSTQEKVRCKGKIVGAAMVSGAFLCPSFRLLFPGIHPYFLSVSPSCPTHPPNQGLFLSCWRRAERLIRARILIAESPSVQSLLEILCSNHSLSLDLICLVRQRVFAAPALCHILGGVIQRGKTGQ